MKFFYFVQTYILKTLDLAKFLTFFLSVTTVFVLSKTNKKNNNLPGVILNVVRNYFSSATINRCLRIQFVHHRQPPRYRDFLFSSSRFETRWNFCTKFNLSESAFRKNNNVVMKKNIIIIAPLRHIRNDFHFRLSATMSCPGPSNTVTCDRSDPLNVIIKIQLSTFLGNCKCTT